MTISKSQCSHLGLTILVWLLSCALTICTSSSAKEKVDGNDFDEPNCSTSASTSTSTSTSTSGVTENGGPPFCLEHHQQFRVPDDCQLVYAKVPDTDDDDDDDDDGDLDQWATYTMVPRKKGTPVRQHGDIVIQWTDPVPVPAPEPSHNKDNDYDYMNHHTSSTLRGLTWNGQETGGHYEGQTWVESVVTGIGMTARSTAKNSNTNNILPLVPRVDEGSLTRFDSPGAGAITRYHNYTWWFSKDLQAGDELVYTQYSTSDGKMAPVASLPLQATKETTTDENKNKNHNNNLNNERKRIKPSLEYLKANGYCMDNLRPRKSRVKEAGRGAFATRDLSKNSVVAPVPVALVHRDELVRKNNENENENENDKQQQQQQHQLLLNYCLGHKSSNWLLFPYAPVVNLINHYNEPNVELRWSAASNRNQSNSNTNTNPTMLLELVANRPIKMGEEIYLDYGRDWEDSWWKHVQETWKPNNKHYTPSYVMDDAIRMMRTEQEQKEHPYPDNVFTSCFYRYSDRSEEEQTTGQTQNSKSKDSLTSFRWHLTKGLFDLKNMRPCQVLKRMEDDNLTGRSAYAVRMLNRPGLTKGEVIPKGELHIVTHIPRAAIRFSDKTGTTDQHLKNAFRHEIELAEDLIPEAWKVQQQKDDDHHILIHPS